jgi:hypothetical protein
VIGRAVSLSGSAKGFSVDNCKSLFSKHWYHFLSHLMYSL